jgi:predicted porin
MKKSLFALAAVTAFAGAAQAQSSVTVYGILDVGYTGANARASTNATGVLKETTRRSGNSMESGSRIGFRGTEALGGGTSAFFTAEFALNPTNMNLSGDANGGLFNRQSFVGLAQKGVGRAAVGTQYTPIHLLVGATDPGQQNNMIGSIIYTTNASQGSGQTATSYTVRYNNALTLMTERLAGFQINGIYNNNNSNSNNTIAVGSTNNSTGTTVATVGVSQQNNTSWGLGANYVWQKLNVDVAYQTSANQSIYANANATVAAVTSTVPGTVNAPANVLGTNLNMNQLYTGAVYDFGINKLTTVAEETMTKKVIKIIQKRAFKISKNWVNVISL